MNLISGVLRPGTVLEVLDNKGTIKASAPGLFEKADQEFLPPVSVFPTGCANSFSSPVVGDEVWILSFGNNPELLWWFRKDKFDYNNSKGSKSNAKVVGIESIQDQQNVEVVVNRQSDGGWATIYFSDGTGWVIQNQDVVLQLDPKGRILLSNGHPSGIVDINEDNISLGAKGKASHPACHGDKVADLFDNLISTLKAIESAAQGSPYTASIATAIKMSLIKYEKDSQFINSDVVTLE